MDHRTKTAVLSTTLATLSALAIIHITSRQHLDLERWLPSIHWLGVALFALGGSVLERLGFKSSLLDTIRPDFALRSRWDIIIAVLLATQRTLELWSFLKLPSATAIMISLLAIPLNLCHISYFPPSAARASSVMSTRFCGLALLFLIGLGIASAGKQEHLCTLQAFGAVALSVIVNRLSLTGHAPSPYSFASIVMAIPVSISYALTFGRSLMGQKLYVVRPLAPGVLSTALFATWFIMSQGSRAGFAANGAKVPTSQTLTARGVLLTHSLPPLVSSFAAVFLTILSGTNLDITGGRGPVWLQSIIFAAMIALILWIAPRISDEAFGEDGEYSLMTANTSHDKSPAYAHSIPLSLMPVLSVISIVPIIIIIAQQSGIMIYRPTFDTLAASSSVSQPLPGTITLFPQDVTPILEASSLLDNVASNSLRPQLEVVVAYYQEPIDGLREIGRLISRQVNWWNTKITVYHKGLGDLYAPTNTSGWIQQKEILTDFITKSRVDKVVPLENIGREGATYLRHILHHWDDLAYQTLFMQGHVAFEDEFWERLRLVNERIGFMSLGHYLLVAHGVDSWGNGEFPRMGDIFELFRERPYPIEPLLSTYHGQFIVSRERIRRHPKHKYEKLLKMLEAPIDDPIHKEGWGYKGIAAGPANPFFGHSLERAWTFIFDCDDPLIEQDCMLRDPASYRCYCPDL